MSPPVQIQIFRDGRMTGQVVLDGSRKVNKIGKTSSAQIKLDDPEASHQARRSRGFAGSCCDRGVTRRGVVD
jgi:hypothetical protein